MKARAGPHEVVEFLPGWRNRATTDGDGRRAEEKDYDEATK